jgi:hypothetical protein
MSTLPLSTWRTYRWRQPRTCPQAGARSGLASILIGRGNAPLNRLVGPCSQHGAGPAPARSLPASSLSRAPASVQYVCRHYILPSLRVVADLSNCGNMFRTRKSCVARSDVQSGAARRLKLSAPPWLAPAPALVGSLAVAGSRSLSRSSRRSPVPVQTPPGTTHSHTWVQTLSGACLVPELRARGARAGSFAEASAPANPHQLAEGMAQDPGGLPFQPMSSMAGLLNAAREKRALPPVRPYGSAQLVLGTELSADHSRCPAREIKYAASPAPAGRHRGYKVRVTCAPPGPRSARR